MQHWLGKRLLELAPLTFFYCCFFKVSAKALLYYAFIG